MKDGSGNNFFKIMVFMLIPMILFIAYFYYIEQTSHEDKIKQVEMKMAKLLLNNEEFIREHIDSQQLLISQDKEEIVNELFSVYSLEENNLFFDLGLDRLSYSAIGMYSLDRGEVIFHIGMEKLYQKLDSAKINQQITKDLKSFYIKFGGFIYYVEPIFINNQLKGYIYTSQDKYFEQTGFTEIFTLIFLAITFALIGAKWVEKRTQKKIHVLKKELELLKDTEMLLKVPDDQFGEIAQSVNELKQHLSEQKDHLSSLLDTLPLGVIHYDETGKVKNINERALQITGFNKEEISDFTVKGNILSSSEYVFWETLRSGQSFLGFESYCPIKDGREIPVMTSTSSLFDKDNNFIGTISSFIDISEQDRLRKIEQKAKVMLDHISDGVIMVDNFGIINGFNSGAEEMTGFRAKEVLGKKYDDIFIKRKTIFTKLTQTLSTKVEYANYKKETTTHDGRKIYLMITTKIILDETGQQLGAMGIYKDITHLEELSQQIQRADKLAVVGELAAGTAHEIRNPLTTIKGFIQLLSNEIADPQKQMYINLILEEIGNINRIIKEMILLAKPSYPSIDTASINQAIKDIVVFMNAEALLFKSEIITELDNDLLDIEIDVRQIKQVFINIIRNGLQSMKNGGIIKVKSRLNDNNMVEIIFEDQGEGIPANQLSKIYEPFFTTKDDGTGLGIPVSYRIMKNHNGDLHVNSIVGKGTQVTLVFPISADDS